MAVSTRTHPSLEHLLGKRLSPLGSHPGGGAGFGGAGFGRASGTPSRQALRSSERTAAARAPVPGKRQGPERREGRGGARGRCRARPLGSCVTAGARGCARAVDSNGGGSEGGARAAGPAGGGGG